MLWFAGLALLVAGDARPEDQIELRNGKKLTGYVLTEGEKSVRFQVGSREQEIDVADRADPLANHAGDRARSARVAAGDGVSGKLDLARYCRTVACRAVRRRLLALTVVVNDEAHTLLGHVKRQTLIKRQRIPFDELVAAQPAFANPGSCDHYELTTNVALADATRALSTWALSRVLPLRARASCGAVEFMGVGIYATRPLIPSRPVDAWPTSGLNYVYVNAEPDSIATRVPRGTHGLLHNTAERTRTGRGEIRWLDEGLPDVGWAWRRLGGRLSLVSPTPHSTHRDARSL